MTLAEASRQNYTAPDRGLNHEELHLAAALRIAAACETIAKSRDDLEQQAAHYKNLARMHCMRADNRDKSLNAMRGWHTRNTTKIKQLKSYIEELKLRNAQQAALIEQLESERTA